MRGRGQSDLSGSTATLTRSRESNKSFNIAPVNAQNRVVKPGYRPIGSNKPVDKNLYPDKIELYDNGGVSYSADNKYDLSADQFELLARLEETRDKYNKDNKKEKEFFSAKELAEKYPDLDGPLVSRKLRELKDKGLIKEEKGKNGLSFALNEDLDNIYESASIYISGGYKSFPVNLSRTRAFSQEEKDKGSRLLFQHDSNTNYPTVTHVYEAAFCRAVRNIEKSLKENKNAEVTEVIQAGKAPNGKPEVLIIKAEKIKTGKFKKETFLTFKRQIFDENSSLDIKADKRPNTWFNDGTCRPEDVFEAARVLENRRKVERGLI